MGRRVPSQNCRNLITVGYYIEFPNDQLLRGVSERVTLSAKTKTVLGKW